MIKLNAFTVDLEDWFCVSNMEGLIAPGDWDEQESRIESSTGAILSLLRENSVSATFFVLGWISDRFPELVKRIYDEGHEIGIHGYNHRKVQAMDRTAFSEDVKKTIASVSAAVPKKAIAGYRAPSFSIGPDRAWAFDILGSFGLRFDSSVNPVSGHPDYGWPNFRRDIHCMPCGLVEVPMTPWLGGGYFRLLPYAASRFVLKRANHAGRAAVFYMHPWEIDPGQPRVSLPLQKRFRHYVNLNRTMERLSRLLKEFRFGTVGDVLDENGF